MGPTLILLFMKTCLLDLPDYEFSQIWGALYLEFNIEAKKWPSRYYSAFMARRLILAGSIHFLRNFPIIQLVICVIVCWIMFLYVAIIKPFISRSNNIINIGTELCISVAYTLIMLYKFIFIYKDVIIWAIFSIVYLSYALKYGSILYNLLKLIKDKLRPRVIQERPTEFLPNANTN
jgi:hypothetical protein